MAWACNENEWTLTTKKKAIELKLNGKRSIGRPRSREYEHILNIAVTNGFDKKLVDKKITNFRRLKQTEETTLSNIKGKPGKVKW